MKSESQTIEYKESWHDEYLKWICGFANAQGGTLYIGVNDDKQVVGVKNAKRLMEDIPNMVKDRMGILIDVNLLESDGKEYLQLITSSSPNPISIRGKYYYRTGSTLQELRGTALDQFLLSLDGDILRRKAVVHINAQLAGGQVPDMAHAGRYLIVLAQIFADGLRLGRRLHDDEFCHYVLLLYINPHQPLCSGKRRSPPFFLETPVCRTAKGSPR